MSSLVRSLALVAGAVGSPLAPQTAPDPLTRPIAPAYAARWLTPQRPFRVFGNTYVVGFKGLTVALVRTSAGLVLVDAALPQAVPAIEANIRSLGFNLKDIKYILSTEPHYDHAGGLAAIERDSGATIIASAPAAEIIRRGQTDLGDPQAAWLERFPAAMNVVPVRDGHELKVGSTTFRAISTAGHTAGSTSYTWRSCETAKCVQVVFASSLKPVAADGYKFSDPAHRAILAAFKRSFDRMRNVQCDVLLSAHPDQSGADQKAAALLAGQMPNPFVDRGACRRYAQTNSALLSARLLEEAKTR